MDKRNEMHGQAGPGKADCTLARGFCIQPTKCPDLKRQVRAFFYQAPFGVPSFISWVSFGEQREGIDVTGANDREMAAIECHDFRNPESFADRQHDRIGRTQRQVFVVQHQFGGASIVIVGEFDRPECVVRQRVQELGLDPRTAVALEQIGARLARRSYRHDMARSADENVLVLSGTRAAADRLEIPHGQKMSSSLGRVDWVEPAHLAESGEIRVRADDRQAMFDAQRGQCGIADQVAA